MTLNHTHLIWDFNGTILQDVDLGIRCTNTMLSARNLAVIPSVEAYREVFGFPIDEYYRRMGFDFEKEDYDTVLAPEWVAMYMEGEPTCPMMEGAAEAIAAVKALGIPQVLLSATEIDMLTGQLERLGIRGEFREVIGLDNIHARSKKAQALAWKERNPDARPLFVGDTLHDADVAAAVGDHGGDALPSRMGKLENEDGGDTTGLHGHPPHILHHGLEGGEVFGGQHHLSGIGAPLGADGAGLHPDESRSALGGAAILLQGQLPGGAVGVAVTALHGLQGHAVGDQYIVDADLTVDHTLSPIRGAVKNFFPYSITSIREIVKGFFVLF